MTGSVKEITKLEKTSLSDFKLHTEECQGQAFFSRSVCATVGGMTGRLKGMEPGRENGGADRRKGKWRKN